MDFNIINRIAHSEKNIFVRFKLFESKIVIICSTTKFMANGRREW
jgi:hypothetical protein